MTDSDLFFFFSCLCPDQKSMNIHLSVVLLLFSTNRSIRIFQIMTTETSTSEPKLAFVDKSSTFRLIFAYEFRLVREQFSALEILCWTSVLKFRHHFLKRKLTNEKTSVEICFRVTEL